MSSKFGRISAHAFRHNGSFSLVVAVDNFRNKDQKQYCTAYRKDNAREDKEECIRIFARNDKNRDSNEADQDDEREGPEDIFAFGKLGGDLSGIVGLIHGDNNSSKVDNR